MIATIRHGIQLPLVSVAAMAAVALIPADVRAVVVEPVAVTRDSGAYGPGAGNGEFTRFWNQSNASFQPKYDINRNGTVVFEGTTGPTNQALWSSAPGSTPELELSSFDGLLERIEYPQISDGGSVVFAGSSVSGNSGLWSLNQGTTDRGATPLVLSGRDNELGPQLGDGEEFSSFGFDLSSGFSFAVGPEAAAAFLGRVSSSSGIWRASNQAGVEPLLLARTDGPLGPGLGEDVDFSSFGSPLINDEGEVLVGAAGRSSNREVDGVWRISADGVERSLVVAVDSEFDQSSPFGFDFDYADVMSHDANGNAALWLSRSMSNPSNDSAGIGFVTSSRPAVQVAIGHTDGVGGPQLGPGVEFEFRGLGFNAYTVVAGDYLAFMAPVQGIDEGIWLADSEGNLQTVAIDPRVSTTTDVPRVQMQPGTVIDLTPQGELVFSNGLELWLYANEELVHLIGDGTPVDFDPVDGADARHVTEVQSFVLDDSGWVAAQVRVTGNADALVRLNIRDLLRGDYNADSVVSAADYSAWRDSINTLPGTLPNDGLGNRVGADQYALWQSRFGESNAAVSLLSVPEPTTAHMLLLAGGLTSAFRRKFDRSN